MPSIALRLLRPSEREQRSASGRAASVHRWSAGKVDEEATVHRSTTCHSCWRGQRSHIRCLPGGSLHVAWKGQAGSRPGSTNPERSRRRLHTATHNEFAPGGYKHRFGCAGNINCDPIPWNERWIEQPAFELFRVFRLRPSVARRRDRVQKVLIQGCAAMTADQGIRLILVLAYGAESL